MILVAVGSQKFQFNRLLRKIDELVEKNIITDKVFAQIGFSDYKPINYEFVDFFSQDEFNKKLTECSIIITHAGTGVIMNSIKRGKKVIAVPRLKKYQEHVDNHQIQIIKQFEELNLIEAVYEIDEIENALKKIKKKKYNKYVSNTENVLKSIKEYIEKE